jgi:hypothetical protein
VEHSLAMRKPGNINAFAFTYRIHGTDAARIATPLQTLCVTPTAFLPKLFEHQPSIS